LTPMEVACSMATFLSTMNSSIAKTRK
jgi:hypothetical protein